MRFRLWVKLSMLAALAVVTFLVTSSVMARGKPRGAQHAIAANEAGLPGRFLGPGGSMPGSIVMGQPGPRVVGIDTTFASGVMHRINVETAANVVHVVGSASIMDKRPGMTYVWSVRALHPTTGKVLFEKRYENQIFAMPAEQQMSPTFDDKIELPLLPGTYTVELVAFMIYPNQGVATLNDASIAAQQRGPVGRAQVKLGE